MGKSKREPISTKKTKLTPGGSCNAVVIREGEILTDVTQKEWRVGKSVGAGGFGEIYLVSDDTSKPVSHDAVYAAKIEPHKNGPLFVEMNFYIRVAKPDMIATWKKEKALHHLGMPHYIAFGSHWYQGEKFRFLILPRFGQDLGQLFTKSKQKFHIKTVLTLGVQILDILEYIHCHGYIHADVKGSNLMLGYGKEEDQVYLLDYGLACRYIDSLGAHKEYNPDQRKAHDGTLEYTSRDAHVGAHSRRGDLEVLAYNMVHWLCGWLPWQDEIHDPERVAREKNNSMNNIPNFLKSCFGDDPPAVLSHFLKYIASLSFEAKPDYSYCKNLLKQGLHQAGYADNGKLNFISKPAKLKSIKRHRDADIENCAQLKPIKIPRAANRQPCVPVQQNSNRITRQQTAANTLALRSREAFDWVKILQSNPEKLLKSHNVNHDQSRRKRETKKKACDVEFLIRKGEGNPLDNPTPAMCEVLKLRSTAAHCNVGRRPRTDSHYSSSLYENSTITPAMEQVLKRREVAKLFEQETKFRTIITATSARANRLKNRIDVNVIKPAARKVELVQLTKLNRKISAPDKNNADHIRIRTRTRKYSLQDRKLVPELDLQVESHEFQKKLPRSNIEMQKFLNSLPTSPKCPKTRRLRQLNKSRSRRRDVSPSEIDFVPRLRSGADFSEDLKVLKYWSHMQFLDKKIRSYAATGAAQKRPTRCSDCGFPKLSKKTRRFSNITKSLVF